jgi:hypothetical protein
MNEVHNLLREYEDLFPKTFSELKGIKGAMGEMKIELKPDSKPVKHRPYHLNPKIKEKVKKEVEKMLAAGLIFPIEEAEWISPIVIQRKKDTEDIRVCVDYKSMNSACVHDPFPTPFSDEVLDQVAENNLIHLQMDSQDITKSELQRKTRRRPHS